MKITFNIEKKHLMVLMIIIGVVVAGIAIASTWDNSQSHDTLWTRYIKGRNSNDVTFYDDIKMSTGKAVRTDSLTAATTGGPITVLDNVIISGKGLGVGGIVTGTSGVRLNYYTIAKPTCDANTEGMLWYFRNGAIGNLQACISTSASTYGWYNIKACSGSC